MFRILLVDDERAEREVIRFLIGKFQFELDITEAINGKEALSLLEAQSFDILFTDIKMPFVDGMELANKARLLYPDMSIIFFSGYDDFEYVKEALSLRVVNYILKPVNPLEFEKTIAEVLTTIKEQEIHKDKQKLALEVTKNHVLYQLINKTPLEVLKRMYPSLDFDFAYRYHRLCLIQLEADFTDFFPQDMDKFLPEDSDFINLNPSQSLLLFSGNPQPLSWYEQQVDTLVVRLKEFCKMDCHSEISNPFSLPEEISKSYEEMEQLLADRFFFTSKITEQSSVTKDDTLLKEIEKNIQYKDSFCLQQNVTLLLQTYKDKNQYSHIYIRFLCTSLLRLLLDALKTPSETYFNELAEQIYNFRHFDDIQKIILEILAKLLTQIDQEQQSPKHAIHLVKNYIHEHYGDDLGLNLLAEKVYLTPRYLSTMFIQETGCGLNKYIKNVRMEKAKDLLLNTNRKITDICQHVGYFNVSYFCKSFQEDFGTTPDKYRHQKI